MPQTLPDELPLFADDGAPPGPASVAAYPSMYATEQTDSEGAVHDLTLARTIMATRGRFAIAFGLIRTFFTSGGRPCD